MAKVASANATLHYVSFNERRANLDLIAAAPELLEELKDLTGFMFRLDVSCQKNSIARCQCQDCCHKRARAVIAKAEGLECLKIRES